MFAVSSAGAVFKLMEAVPPLSLAAWRLQLTTLLLFPGCAVNFRSLPPGAHLHTSARARLAWSETWLAALC